MGPPTRTRPSRTRSPKLGSPAASTSSRSLSRTGRGWRPCCARLAKKGSRLSPGTRIRSPTPQGIGTTLMDHAARILGNKGEFAIITASLTAANMIAWQKHIEAQRASQYPDIKMVALRPCDDLQKKPFDE